MNDAEEEASTTRYDISPTTTLEANPRRLTYAITPWVIYPSVDAPAGVACLSPRPRRDGVKTRLHQQEVEKNRERLVLRVILIISSEPWTQNPGRLVPVVFPRPYRVSGKIKGSAMVQHGCPSVVFVHLKLAQDELGKGGFHNPGKCIIFPGYIFGSKGTARGKMIIDNPRTPAPSTLSSATHSYSARRFRLFQATPTRSKMNYLCAMLMLCLAAAVSGFVVQPPASFPRGLAARAATTQVTSQVCGMIDRIVAAAT